MKKILALSLFALSVGTTAHAQQANPDGAAPQKWDKALNTLLHRGLDVSKAGKSARTNARDAVGTAGNTAEEMVSVIITTKDSQVLVDSLRKQGYTATAINETTATATLPLSSVRDVAGMKSTRFISKSRKHRPFLKKARASVGIDRIEKEYLETPYDGSGVIVAVIDQGFELTHRAFLNDDGKSRIIAAWDHSNKAKTPVYTNFPQKDKYVVSDGSHATHVANIAGGSKYDGNEYHGMAPKSNLILIPSTFEDAEILNDLHFIDSIAAARKMPWVANMSFGSNIGPHDGTQTFDQAANSFLKDKSGRMLVAAMGNDGDQNLHVSHKFTANNEKVYVAATQEFGADYLIMDLWGQKADSASHLNVKAYVIDAENTTKSKEVTFSSPKDQDRIWEKEINPQNKKENWFFAENIVNGYIDYDDSHLLLEITGNDGDEFHAWINETTGEWQGELEGYTIVKPNADFGVGEGSATIPAAVAVGAYTTANSWKSLNGSTYRTQTNTINGRMADFSSHGPYLGAEKKPTVAAPGTMIASAVSRFENGFSTKGKDVVQVVDYNKKKYYYGVMQGTSMAAPAVTGIIALWLQANPSLTTEQIHDILHTTSNKDQNKGEDWHPIAGYGKIDAYAGLKKALELTTGIDEVYSSKTPVTILKSEDQWKVLFNSNETRAQLQVYSLSGQLMKGYTLNDVRRGTEQLLSFSDLPAGVYVVRIITPSAQLSKKVMVK